MALTGHMNHVYPTTPLMIGLMIGLMDFRRHLDLLMPLRSFDALLLLHITHLKWVVVMVFVRGLDLHYLYHPCHRFYCFDFQLACS
jgi:hypothetical protein